MIEYIAYYGIMIILTVVASIATYISFTGFFDTIIEAIKEMKNI